jgi:hypothetical protein
MERLRLPNSKGTQLNTGKSRGNPGEIRENPAKIETVFKRVYQDWVRQLEAQKTLATMQFSGVDLDDRQIFAQLFQTSTA